MMSSRHPILKSLHLLLLLGLIGIGPALHAQEDEQANPLPVLAPASPEMLDEHAMHHHESYVCPMHPQVISSEPGRCPICGMDLVAKQVQENMPVEHAKAAPEPGPVVQVAHGVINQLGVRTAEVHRGTLTRQIEGFGVFLRSTVQGFRPSYHGSASSANDTNTSTSAMLVQGQVFERQAPLLQIGQVVRVHVPGLGSREWEGKLIGLESQVNQTTHTQVFHVSVSPEAASVPPGMNANLVVEVTPVSDVLLVPREAVIVTGRGARVIVALGEGRFQQREVDVEDFGEERIVVRNGLREGEQVVISAQFMLDSEANLQAGLKRLTGDQPKAETAAEGNHP
jgi:hypothetical protein